MRKTGVLVSSIILMLTLFGQSTYPQTNVTIGTESISMRLNAVVADRSMSNLVYPREYTVYNDQGECVYGRGFLIASKNFKTKWIFSSGQWTELEQETTLAYFISDATPNYHEDRTHSAVELNITKYWKYKAPFREVNLQNFSDDDWHGYDKVGGPNMICEQMVVASCNTAHGITLTQRAYAFHDPKYDDFIIVEYIFKNIGDIDSDPEVEYPNNQVKDCYLALKFIPMPSNLSSLVVPGAGGWMPQVDDWIDYYSGYYNGEPLRVMYGWDGDARTEYCADDDEGDPFPVSGIFMSTQYPGMAILHVDKEVNDHTNDPNQPIMSYYSWGGAHASNTLSIGAGSIGAESIYNTLSTPEHITSPLDWETWNSTQTEVWNTAYGNDPNVEYYKTGTIGFGPYNFQNIGDSVRIVACYTVGSIGWTEAVELGSWWKEKLPNPTTNDIIEKNRILRSGRDSLFAKIAQVTALFKDASGNIDLIKGADIIGDPAQPPGLTISSDLESIQLKWENVGADKYRVYRRLKPTFALENEPGELIQDPYPLRRELDGNETSWKDTDISIGQDYWYCVSAVNDAGIESSKSLTRTNPTSSDRTRGAAQPYSSVPSTALDSLYVVPNPYNYKSEQFYSGVMTRGNIKFYGLPAQCRIRIYTQSGDLVATLDHELTYPPSTVHTWNMLTDSDQYIASGLYIFTIDQAKDHMDNDVKKVKVGKFIVIR